MQTISVHPARLFILAFTSILLFHGSARGDLSGLVGHWTFEEGSGPTTADVTSTNHGTLVGAPAWVASPLGTYALSFDGGDDYVDIGDPASEELDFTETQSFSYGAWIKPSIINATGRRFISKISGAENIGFALGVWEGSQGVFADVSDGTMELSTGDFFDIPVPLGEWSFVMAVINRTDAIMRVYVNGVEAQSSLDIYGLGSFASTAALNFGRASGNSAKSFAGVIDGVRFYNRALTGADVQELFASMQTPLGFVSQPTNQTIEWSQPVTFTASVSGSPPYFCQWFSNSVAIEGETHLSYTIPSTALEMSGTVYSISVSNLLPSSISSTGATLTVLQDFTRPTLVSAVARYSNEVVAAFSEVLAVSGAQDPGNYAITNSTGQAIGVTSAVVGTDGRVVTLVTSSALVEGTDYVLVVSGVQDVSTPPNTILPGTTNTFRLNTLVGHWAFEEGSGTTAADLSGYGNHATLVNGPAWVDGKVGKALRFDGSNDSVSAGDPVNGLLDFGATHSFSYGAWINPAVLDTTGRRVISKRDSSDIGYEFGVISRNGVGVFTELGDGAMAPSSYDAGILVPITVGQWYHVMTVVDRSANEMRLYVDGNLQGTVSVVGLASIEMSGPLTFGRPSSENAKFFSGMLDDVRIYSRVLTEDEIRELSNAGARPLFLPPTISGGEIHLNWIGTGQLEWAASVVGPWTPVTPAPVPPYSETVVPGENRFFRLSVGP